MIRVEHLLRRVKIPLHGTAFSEIIWSDKDADGRVPDHKSFHAIRVCLHMDMVISSRRQLCNHSGHKRHRGTYLSIRERERGTLLE